MKRRQRGLCFPERKIDRKIDALVLAAKAVGLPAADRA
jgi:hypothetical protein